MPKRFTIGLLVFVAGVAGNLIAGWLQQGKWAIQPTTGQFLGTLVGAGLILLMVALLESESALSWNWRWHRFWYLRELLNNPDLRHWETDFARLEMVQGRQKVFGVEVIAEGRRQDMVEVLRELIIGRREKTCRTLVLGEPGSGKTTGLERLTLDLASAGVRRLGFGRPMPVLVKLGNLQQGKLLDFVAEEMRHCTKGSSGKALSKGIEKLLEKGYLVLLLDALDEALGEHREVVLAELAKFLNSRAYECVAMVISSRTREEPGSRLKVLPTLVIQDLSDEAVNAFIKICKRREQGEEEIRTRLEGLLAPGGIGRNPFWLRLIVKHGAYEGRKAQILNSTIDDLLTKEWDKPETKHAWHKVLNKSEQLEETKLALAWLSYRMSVENKLAVDKDQAFDELTKWLKGRISVNELRPQDIIRLGQDAQILAYSAGPMRFRHRLLQEFMTAWALKLEKKLLSQELEQRSRDFNWWQTLLLLSEIIDDFPAFVRQVLGNSSVAERAFLAFGLLDSDPDFVLPKLVFTELKRPLQSVNQLVSQLLPQAKWNSLLRYLLELTRLTPIQHKVTLAFAQCILQGVTDVHCHAFIKLRQIGGGKIVDRLASLLLISESVECKKQVIILLQSIHEPQTAEYLVVALSDESISHQASKALLQLGTLGIEPLIQAFGWNTEERSDEDNANLQTERDKLQSTKAELNNLLETIDDRETARSIKKQIKMAETSIQLLNIAENAFEKTKQLKQMKQRLPQELKKAVQQQLEQNGMPEIAQSLDEFIKTEGWISQCVPDRDLIIDTLVKIGESAVEPLILVFNNASLLEADIRDGAAHVLAKIGSKRAIDALIAGLNRDHLVASIQRALKNAGVPVADALIMALNSDNQCTRLLASGILTAMGRTTLAPLAKAATEGRLNLERGMPVLIEIAGKLENLDVAINLLESDNTDLQVVAEFALRKIGEPAIDKLIALLGKPEISKRVARVLGMDIGMIAVEPLTNALNHTNAYMRAGAAEALGYIALRYNIDNPRTIQSLIQGMQDDNKEVYTVAETALAQIGEPAIDYVNRLLNNEDKRIHLSAVLCLFQMSICHTINLTYPLLSVLDDSNWQIRNFIIGALGQSGDKRALIPLIRRLPEEPKINRTAILRALARIVFRPILHLRRIKGKRLKLSDIKEIRK